MVFVPLLCITPIDLPKALFIADNTISNHPLTSLILEYSLLSVLQSQTCTWKDSRDYLHDFVAFDPGTSVRIACDTCSLACNKGKIKKASR